MLWIDYYWYIVLVLPAVLLSVIAQVKVKTTFSKYSRVPTVSGMSGAETSELIQRYSGLQVPVVQTAGSLTDHYDPTAQIIRLSQPVFDSRSVAAIGVAAHETGHALQYAENYGPAAWRAAIVKPTQFASMFAPYLVIVGILTSFPPLAMVGVAFFGLAVLFQLVTLPVEFNASARAMTHLRDSGRFTEEELIGVRKVLTAAAMTYVASLLVALMSFLRLLLIVNGGRRNSR